MRRGWPWFDLTVQPPRSRLLSSALASAVVFFAVGSLGACAPVAQQSPVAQPAQPPVAQPASAPVAPAPVAPAAATTAPALPTRLSHLLVHMDHAPRATVEQVQASRRQQVEWIRSHGAAVGEVPTYWVRVGADRMWAARPATSWENIRELGKRLGQLDEAITAGVGKAFEANEQRMHEAIDEHHNELLRPVESLTLTSDQSPMLRDVVHVTDLGALVSLRVIAIDKPIPARAGVYLAAIQKINVALRTAQTGIWRAVYSSNLGSGAYVHFIGTRLPMKPAELEAAIDRALVASVGRAEATRLQQELKASLAQHELVEARLDADLSSMPSMAGAATGATTN